ncbi:MAG: hypothetical protein ACLGG8_08645 [Gammaproteobacteria bacterium]
MCPNDIVLTRRHDQRLRDIHRSAGWPCQDLLEVELLAVGMLQRCFDGDGRQTLRLTDAGIARLASTLAGNRAARSAHETLVGQVALAMHRAGRLAWRGLMLRVALPVSLFDEEAPPPSAASGGLWTDGLDAAPAPTGHAWVMASPDVFSIRRSSVEAYLEPVVHEIKVSRADLQGDLRRPAKRAAYLAMGGACWYVLGRDARGRPIAEADEVPPECGVMQVDAASQLVVCREAPRRAVERLPFHLWMSLAQATPVPRPDEPVQAMF